MERPIVSTTIGAEGLPVEDGTDIRIADDAADFSGAVVSLLRDPAYGAALGAAAARQVREHFGWQHVTEEFAAACAAAVERAHRRHPAGRAA